MAVGVGSLLTMAGGGRVTVGTTGGGSVAVAGEDTAVSSAAISTGAVASAALTGLGDSSPPQATSRVAKMNKRMS